MPNKRLFGSHTHIFGSDNAPVSPWPTYLGGRLQHEARQRVQVSVGEPTRVADLYAVVCAREYRDSEQFGRYRSPIDGHALLAGHESVVGAEKREDGNLDSLERWARVIVEIAEGKVPEFLVLREQDQLAVPIERRKVLAVELPPDVVIGRAFAQRLDQLVVRFERLKHLAVTDSAVG